MAAAETLTVLDDLHLPYRPKRRTCASIACERGLFWAVDLYSEAGASAAGIGTDCASVPEPEVPTIEDAWSGARDIVAVRRSATTQPPGIREKALGWGRCPARGRRRGRRKSVYATYHQFQSRNATASNPINSLGQQTAVRRRRSCASKVTLIERDWLTPIHDVFRPDRRSPLAEQSNWLPPTPLNACCCPQSNAMLGALTEHAGTHAILWPPRGSQPARSLNQPPLAGPHRPRLDPAFGTGCKVAVIDVTLQSVGPPTRSSRDEPQRRWADALEKLLRA
ncbi:MAG: hypothetical protein IPK52_15935 [Chloroflexi bacterium]|nr:hypothetical protein [Chloroflexota bacterium]